MNHKEYTDAVRRRAHIRCALSSLQDVRPPIALTEEYNNLGVAQAKLSFINYKLIIEIQKYENEETEKERLHDKAKAQLTHDALFEGIYISCMKCWNKSFRPGINYDKHFSNYESIMAELGYEHGHDCNKIQEADDEQT